jgi:hypothetical protein
MLDKSEGVAERGEMFLQHSREAVIKEYFFGDARRSLSPQIQQVDFDSVTIYKPSDCMCIKHTCFTLAQYADIYQTPRMVTTRWCARSHPL